MSSLSADKKAPDDDQPSSKRHKTVDGQEDIIDLTGEDILPTTHTSNPPPRPPPSPLYLLRVRGIPDWGNQPPLGLHLSYLLTPPMKWIMTSNYMIDLQWLFSACPAMLSAQQLIFVHGEKHPAHLHQAIQAAGISHKTIIHSPPLPIAFGTYHSKFFLVQYERGLRVIIHSANLIYPDCNNKTQGVWFQDFPLKSVDNTDKDAMQNKQQQHQACSSPPPPSSSYNISTSSFERDLQQYVTSLGLPPPLTRQTHNIIALHDFSSARAHLVASVPGYHKGSAAMNSWGHLKLRTLLNGEDILSGGNNSNNHQLVAQFSSLGSIDEAWLEGEFRTSLQASKDSSKVQPPQPGPTGMALVWPTVSEIQNSLEGWLAGNSVPGPLKNVTKPFLQPYYAKFGGQVVARQRAMPHIKTYLRWDVETREVGWLFLGSHNLSKAAWGALQKKGSQFMIRSYELGVLITPSTEERYRSSWDTDDGIAFSCTTSGGGDSKEKRKPSRRVTLVPWTRPESEVNNNETNKKEGRDGEEKEEEEEEGVVCVPLPIPFKLPPDRYDPDQDVPWAVDMTPKEAPGSDVWGRKVDNPMGRFYGCDERDEWGIDIL